MTVDEIVSEFRNLPHEEQREVFEVMRAKFADEPSPEEMDDFELRAERLRNNPETGIPWDQVRAELKGRLEARRACPVE